MARLRQLAWFVSTLVVFIVGYPLSLLGRGLFGLYVQVKTMWRESGEV